jgi:hypothetical protein
MNTYVNFVRNHSLLVRPVEGLLRTVTFFLPSRFHENGNGEITTEAALAASNVLTLVNDLILLRPGSNTAALLPQTEDRIGLVLMLISHTEVLLEKVSIRLGDGAEHLVVLCLEALKALLRLKLLHLQQQQGGAGTKLLLDGGRVIPSFDNPVSPLPSTITTMADDAGMSCGPASEALAVDADEEQEEETLLRVVRGNGGECKRREDNGSRQEWKRGRRTGRKFLYYASGESNEVVEEGKNTSDDEDDSASSPTSSSSSSSASSSTSSMPSLGASFTAAAKDEVGPGLAVRSMEEEEAVVAKARARLLLTGEVLHILRPLLFAYLRWLVASRRRRAHGPVAVAASVGSGRGRTIPGPLSSFPSAAPEWLPLLLPGLMDAVSHQCTMSAIDRNATLKRSYQDELQRRKNLWLLYLLRTPVFEGLTQPVAGALDRSLGRVPLVGGLANYGFQALLYVQRHFTLTSGS